MAQLIQDIRLRPNYKAPKKLPVDVIVIWSLVGAFVVGLLAVLVWLKAIYI